MAFTKFTVEGTATLGYFAGEPFGKDRSVRIEDDNNVSAPESVDAPSLHGVEPAAAGQRVEDLITRSLDFPNDAEFEEMGRRLDELRQQDLQTAEGTPDITREARLRITVEVID